MNVSHALSFTLKAAGTENHTKPDAAAGDGDLITGIGKSYSETTEPGQ